MADKIKAIKIKQKNGTYSEEVPISVNVQNVQWDENNHTLLDALGSVDISSSGKGNLQHQIDELDGDKISTNQFNSRLNDFLKDQISADTTDWLDDNVNPVGSAVIVDKTLTIEGAAADALAVKTELNKKANTSNTYTKAEVNAAIDAKKIEVDDTLSITGTAADAKAVGDELTEIKADLGSLMEPQRLADRTDLNTVTTPGTYTLHTGWTYTSKPTSDAEHGILEVWHEDYDGNPSRIFQRLTYTYKAGRTCAEIWIRASRTISGSEWAPWISTTGDLTRKSILLSDNVPDTTQSYTFADGKVSKVTHSRNSVAIRTDAFTYGTGTITEVRTLNTGESLTIVTNLTTLETTVTYNGGV